MIQDFESFTERYTPYSGRSDDLNQFLSAQEYLELIILDYCEYVKGYITWACKDIDDSLELAKIRKESLSALSMANKFVYGNKS